MHGQRDLRRRWNNMKVKVIIIPGNGGGTPNDNWFPYIKNELEKLDLIVIAKEYPDPMLAREKYWLPFIKKLGADENTILIGHSSGAIAAMRFAENHQILGSVLVGAYYTDLGLEEEKKSGYFNRPWKWNQIRNNQKCIILFASTDDPFIPIQEARHINENLNAEYYEYQNEGHFGHGNKPKKEFPEIINVIKSKLNKI